MREIKFRAWSRKFKEMIYKENTLYSIDVHGNTVWKDSVDDEVAILTQFTGLKDKNGKEIYEWDLFQVAKNHVYQVKYSTGGENNYEWHGACFILFIDDEKKFPFDEWAMEHGEVIGNIYENPELLVV